MTDWKKFSDAGNALDGGWQPIDTAPKDGTIVSVRWRLVSERRWHKARASYRTERKPALFDPLSGECFARTRDLSGWMYEDQPYLIPGVVEWYSEEAQ